uniref:Tetratricopeptide repeat protein n=1 Tax=Streptomyces sp. NBC_00008 TaxID=2903610 RepID=A0AAU2VPG1_9ACTN
MNQLRKVDQDDIVRARNVLLASGRRTPGEEVDAYRVLAQVSPVSYLPLLASALQRLSYDDGSCKRHASCLALCEEAVAVARSIDPAEPGRADVLYRALDTFQRELYRVGRHTEGLALRAEMLAMGRAQAELSGDPVVKGLGEWAAGLSEEGRYAEAADAMTELVAAMLSYEPRSGTLVWSLLEWIAALHDAGRSGEALAAFETLVGTEAAEAADDRRSMAGHLYSLIGYAQMLDAYGRAERAALARQEALVLLERLADTSERKSWSGYRTSFWAVLLSMSGAGSGRPASDGTHPSSGADPMHWSPSAKQRYFDSRHALREEVDTLALRAAEDPDRHLAELVRLNRVLTIRSAVYWKSQTHRFAKEMHSLFDDGVSLALQLFRHDPEEGKRTLARNLIDRSTFHTATGEFGPALDDFRQALSCLGEAD